MSQGGAPEPKPEAGAPAKGTTDRTDKRVLPRLPAVVGRLSAVNVVVGAVTILTTPLQARALGPAGRGELAAIVVTMTFASSIGHLGLPGYVVFRVARRARLATVIGTTGALAALPMVLIVVAAPFVAELVGAHSQTVETWALVALLTTPLVIAAYVLLGVNEGLQRWKAVYGARALPALITLVATVILFALGALTVATAALVAIVSLASFGLPLLGVLRGIGRPRFSASMAREAIPFSLKAWVATTGAITNLRLDQLFMIGLVSARQLGLYATAASIASATTMFTTAVVAGLYPRVAAGEREVAMRALRVTLAGLVAVSAVLMALTPVIIEVVLGSRFGAATPMTLILLVAGIPFGGAMVLYAALAGIGKPGALARGELLGVAVTIPGLLLVLPSFGGVGAASVSLAAYTTKFAYLLWVAKRAYGVRARDFGLLRKSDLSDVRRVMRRRGAPDEPAHVPLAPNERGGP